MSSYDFDLIVIGSGAGGSVGAHHAASLGKKVAVFEREAVGGECPNFACVPTKALLTAAEMLWTAHEAKQFGIKIDNIGFDYREVKGWKDLVVSRTGAAHGEEAFKESGVTLIKSQASLKGPHEVEADGKTYSAEFILLASGTEVFIPPIEGLESSGYITFRQAVDFEKLPKRIFILGGGPIGCEFSQAFSIFGAQVYLVDTLPRLLSRDEKEASELVAALFDNAGVKVLTGCNVKKIVKNENDKTIYYDLDGKEGVITVDEVLVATGKKPFLDFGLEAVGVAHDKKSVTVNEYLQTNIPNIYAAGDIVGPYLFTHTGNYQSFIAANNMFSEKKIKPDYTVVPRCTFTIPEVASVGITEEEALKKGIKIKKGLVPTSILGRANTSNEFDGFVKVVTDENGLILGACIVAPRAGEMIHELALAMKLKAKASDVAEMIHAYPTFSEAVKIACANVE